MTSQKKVPVRLLTAMVSATDSFSPGQIIDRAEDEAKRLVESGAAEFVKIKDEAKAVVAKVEKATRSKRETAAKPDAAETADADAAKPKTQKG